MAINGKNNGVWQNKPVLLLIGPGTIHMWTDTNTGTYNSVPVPFLSVLYSLCWFGTTVSDILKTLTHCFLAKVDSVVPTWFGRVRYPTVNEPSTGDQLKRTVTFNKMTYFSGSNIVGNTTQQHIQHRSSPFRHFNPEMLHILPWKHHQSFQFYPQKFFFAEEKHKNPRRCWCGNKLPSATITPQINTRPPQFFFCG